jgi:hypothetical protein
MDGGKTFAAENAAENGVSAQLREFAAGLCDENVTKAIKSRSECV